MSSRRFKNFFIAALSGAKDQNKNMNSTQLFMIQNIEMTLFIFSYFLIDLSIDLNNKVLILILIILKI